MWRRCSSLSSAFPTRARYHRHTSTGMPLVLFEHFTVGLHSCGTVSAVVPQGRDAIRASGVLVDPIDLCPSFGIRFPWRNQVE